jgi:hypothetical protein
MKRCGGNVLSKTHYKDLISDFLKTETDIFYEMLCPVQNNTQWTNCISMRIPSSDTWKVIQTNEREEMND